MSDGSNPRSGWFLLAMKNGWGSWCAEFLNDETTCSRVPYKRYLQEGYIIKPIVVMTHEEFERRLEEARNEVRNSREVA